MSHYCLMLEIVAIFNIYRGLLAIAVTILQVVIDSQIGQTNVDKKSTWSNHRGQETNVVRPIWSRSQHGRINMAKKPTW